MFWNGYTVRHVTRTRISYPALFSRRLPEQRIWPCEPRQGRHTLIGAPMPPGAATAWRAAGATLAKHVLDLIYAHLSDDEVGTAFNEIL